MGIVANGAAVVSAALKRRGRAPVILSAGSRCEAVFALQSPFVRAFSSRSVSFFTTA
jgi:hypothetical protein